MAGHRRIWVAVVTVLLLGAGTLLVVDRAGERGEAPTSTLVQPATSTSASTTSTTPTEPPSSSTVIIPTTATTAPTTPSAPAVAVRRVETSRRVVALTFDAGSDVGNASAILDVLDTNGLRATFGMTGRWAEQNPALVRRIVAEGHQLVNHTYDHPSFTGRSTGDAALSQADRRDQLARAEQAVHTAAGVSMAPWFRPPYGDEDASVRADVGAAGYRYELLWTVDSLGWKGVAPDEVVQRCLDAAATGPSTCSTWAPLRPTTPRSSASSTASVPAGTASPPPLGCSSSPEPEPRPRGFAEDWRATAPEYGR